MVRYPGHQNIHVLEIVERIIQAGGNRSVLGHRKADVGLAKRHKLYAGRRAGSNPFHAQKLIIPTLANLLSDNYYHLHQDKEDAMKFLCPRHRRSSPAFLSMNRTNYGCSGWNTPSPSARTRMPKR